MHDRVVPISSANVSWLIFAIYRFRSPFLKLALPPAESTRMS